MIAFSSSERAAAVRRELETRDGFRYHKSEWLESGEDQVLSPTIFMVEQPPGSAVRTHFHRQNEFQVVVRGSGWLGPVPLSPYMCHYASAYTGYGPIKAGPDGLAYFTIRGIFESGALFVPEDREQMVRGPKKQFHLGPFDAVDVAQRALLAAPLVTELASERDGAIRVVSQKLPPGAKVQSIDLGKSAMQFNFVLDGAVTARGKSLSRWECVVITAGEAPVMLEAGSDGADILVMLLDERPAEFIGKDPPITHGVSSPVSSPTGIHLEPPRQG